MDYFFIFGAKYLYVVIIGIAVIYFFKQPKTTKNKIIILGTLALPVIYVVAKIVSLLYYDPRPFVEEGFIPIIPHEPDNGFPSDHTLLSAAISSVLYPFNKRVGVMTWILAILVGLSRVYVGVHHYIDVFGSMVISIGVTSLVYIFVKRWKHYSPD